MLRLNRHIASKVCKDNKDGDDEDDDVPVPAGTPSGVRMLSFETLSMPSESSSSSGTLSSCSLSKSDSEVSRLASQLKGLRLIGKDNKDSAGSNVTTSAGSPDSKPAPIPTGNKPEKCLPSAVSQLLLQCMVRT